MSDLAKALDAAERAYATNPTAAAWKAITDAKLAVDQEKTRAAALARIAADDAAAKAEAEKQKLRDELAALSPTLNARAFFATLDAERKAVHAARLALFRSHVELGVRVSDYQEARERAVELHKALGMSPPAHETMTLTKAEAMVTFDAQTVPLHSLLARPTALHECADALGVGQGGGVAPAIRCRLDGDALARMCLRDKLTGSADVAAIVEAEQEKDRARAPINQARAEAIAAARKDINNSEGTIAALADAAEHRAREAIASTTTATEAN